MIEIAPFRGSQEMLKNVGKRLLPLFLAFGCFPAATLAAPILTLTLDLTSLTGGPGSAVTFTGTILNATGVEVFLNGAGGSLSSSELTLDLTPFFTLTPLSLLDGESYTGQIFSVAISSVAVPGDYSGTFAIQGGEDSFTFDTVASADFQIQVSEVPEPSSATLIGLAGVIVGLRYWQRRGCCIRT